MGIDCHYYYPWGTQHNLSKSEFKPLQTRDDFNHAFFHFDQEPLWTDQLGPYDLTQLAWGNKFLKLLANSEHSVLKKQICRTREFQDWYFFYHGFAALDWYSDAKYIDQQHPIKNAFLSLNRTFYKREYRVALLARLLETDIAGRGHISFHSTQQNIQDELDDPHTVISKRSQALLIKNRHRLSELPWRLDDVPVDGNLSARFGHKEYELWQSSLWHLVNETVFYDPKMHLTEKVFKPIVALRPFILVSAPGNLAYLRSYGFRTFDRWIDETYDQIWDHDQRLDLICKELDRFARMSVSDLRRVYHEMLPVLIYNKQHFFTGFRSAITHELLENFQQCLRIWNNGRLGDRQVRLHPDLAPVKELLLR